MRLAAQIRPHFFELCPPATLLFSIAHTHLFSAILQPLHSERLAHSLKNTGGVPTFFPKRNSITSSLAFTRSSPALRLSPHPNMPILGELGFVLIRFGFDQEGSLS
jgi:hypothetical protein